MKKTVIALVIVLVSAVSYAGDVRLMWDANDPAPEGYRIFYRLETGEYNYDAPAWQGTDTTCAISGLTDGETYGFVARAYEGELESVDSDEIIYTVPLPQKIIRYPERPKTIVLQFD